MKAALRPSLRQTEQTIQGFEIPLAATSIAHLAFGERSIALAYVVHTRKVDFGWVNINFFVSGRSLSSFSGERIGQIVVDNAVLSLSTTLPISKTLAIKF